MNTKNLIFQLNLPDDIKRIICDFAADLVLKEDKTFEFVQKLNLTRFEKIKTNTTLHRLYYNHNIESFKLRFQFLQGTFVKYGNRKYVLLVVGYLILINFESD
jgi:hypothetical protein